MRGTDWVLLMCILIGCSCWHSNGAKYRRRATIFDTLENRYQEMDQKVKEMEKRLKKLEKGQCERECPLGYVRHSTSCFRFVMGQANVETWHEARRKCEGLGANLVTINSSAKQSFIAKYIKNNFGHRNYTPVVLYTGLICTNAEASEPYEIRGSSHSSSLDSVRWTATREAVMSSGFLTPMAPLASWQPAEIQGECYGPSSTQLSCVVVLWTPGTKSPLIWRYHDCRERQNYICEIKMKRPRSKCKRKGRKSKKNKRRKRPKRFAQMYQRHGHNLREDDDFSEDFPENEGDHDDMDDEVIDDF